MVNNPPKALILLLIVACATVALCFSRLDSTGYAAIILPIIGYVVGNGIAAKRNEPVEPVLTKKPPPEEE